MIIVSISYTTGITQKTEEYILREVVFHFTTQRSELFLNSLRESLLYNQYADYQYTPFWEHHPEGRFVFRFLFNGFSKYSPLIILASQGVLEPEIVINKIRKDVTEHLLQELDNLTYGSNIDHIIALSGEFYESKNAADLHFAVFPNVTSLLNHPMAIRFTDPVVFSLENLHTIRKQLNFASNRTLAVCYEDNSFKVKGVLSPSHNNAFPYFEFEKHLAWSFFMPVQLQKGKLTSSKLEFASQCIVRYQQGSLMFPLLDLSCEITEKLEQVLQKKTYIASALRMIKMVDQCKHGAVLIMSTQKVIADETRRLVERGNRGTYFDSPKNLLRIRNKDILKLFSEIDGAVFVDFTGRCQACGVILDGYFEPNECHAGNRGRGSRFNSTRLYIDMFQHKDIPIIGVAKSEDGMLDIFSPIDPLIP